MTGSRPVAVLAVLSLLGGIAACSSDDDSGPTTGTAAVHLTKLMDDLRGELTDGSTPLQAWQPSDDASRNRSQGCPDGTARRAYAATLVVPDSTGQDAEGREAKLLGKLGQAGWDPETVAPTSGTDPAEVKGRAKPRQQRRPGHDRVHPGREGLALRGERSNRLPADGRDRQATGSSEASVSPHASFQPLMSLALRSPGPA